MADAKGSKKKEAPLSFEEMLVQCERDLLAVSTESQLRVVYARYAGKEGIIRLALVDALKRASAESKKSVGQTGNEALQKVDRTFQAKWATLQEEERRADLARTLDVTLSGRQHRLGKLHPMTQVRQDVESIFLGMGFSVATGPQVETDFYNFQALGMPEHHPARSAQDTFYLPDGLLLRTHTSSVQIRTMIDCEPPLRVIAPGRVYRNEEDPTHSPAFTQLEGFAVDRMIHFPHLKGVLQLFVQRFFGPGTKYRLRASFFPFVEPGAELDIQCIFCKGKSESCRTCKGTGFIEVMGCGLIHPDVFSKVDEKREVPAYEGYSGFAFGMGLDRLAMLRYGVNDLKLFFSGDMRFTDQLGT